MSLVPVTVYTSFTTAETTFLTGFAGLPYVEGDVFYINASGQVARLGIGSPAQSLVVNAGGTAPEWSTPAGGGDVTKVGTPVNNQIGVWTGNGSIEGDANLTWDGTSFNIATAKNFQIAGATILADAAGTTTLSNIDALDATTEATIEAAIDTLANLVTIQGRTVTLADAGANAIFGWDDVAGAYENLTQAEARTVLGLGTAAYVATDLADLNEATIEGAIDTLANLTSIQGRTITLADAGADAFLIWDDSASAYQNSSQADARVILGLGSAAYVATDLADLNEATIEGAIDTLANLTSIQSLTITLADAGADALLGWDDSASAYQNLSATDARVALGLATTDSPMFTAINLGHASDTTLARVSAGVVSIEGVNILTTATGLPLSGGTMTGNITLAENAAIALDPAGSADGKYTGVTVTGVSGYTQAFGDLVYIDPTDSRWEAVDANSASGADGDARGTLGMVVSAGTDGNACTILLVGIIRADAKFPTFTINNPIWASETAGAVTQTAPTTTDAVRRIVGAAITADEMFFNPSYSWVTHV